MSLVLESGHTVEKLTGEEFERYKVRQPFFEPGAIRLWPHGWFFAASYENFANRVYNFKVMQTDIYVSTFPKSGTNWIQEIVWNLVHNPDLNNSDAEMNIDARCPFLEVDFFFDINGEFFFQPNGQLMTRFNELCPGIDPSDGVHLNLTTYVPEPRLIKNHLPWTLLPPDAIKKSKVIYLARDPRDVIISFYHFFKMHKMLNYTGTLEEFVEDFINDRIIYGPYWEHIKLAWEKRNDPNFLFLHYEDLNGDPKSEIRKMDQFIGTNRTDQQIENIVQYTSFETMKERTKNNPPVSFDNTLFKEESIKKGASFFRKGKCGSWKDDFTPEIEEKVNAWMRKNLTAFEEDFKYKI